jgi:AraC-like DNA-binding protein
MSGVPLSRHTLLRSREVDEVRSRVADAFCPHGLYPTTPGAALAAQFAGVRLGSIGLHYLDYGAEVRIVPRKLRNFFLVQIPMKGSAVIRNGRNEMRSDPGVASVPDPEQPLDMTWGEENSQLIVWLDREALEAQLARMLGREPDRPLRLDLGMDLTHPAAQSWLGLLRMLAADLDGPGLTTAHHAAQKQMESLVMSQLLLCHRHTSSEALRRSGPPVGSKTVRRARALIDDHATEALTVADVAEALGVSVRALQEGFRRHLDTTPTAYLRDARLARAHTMLCEGGPGSTSVAEVATACGFGHLGRFASAYRARYGEPPSATLIR